MSDSEMRRTVEARDRLRVKLDVLGEYERVLRGQLSALEVSDLEQFQQLAEARDELARQLSAVDDPDASDPFGEDLETARLLAEVHLRSNELRSLDERLLGELRGQRDAIREELRRTEAPVSDAAFRYLEAESGGAEGERLDVRL